MQWHIEARNEGGSSSGILGSDGKVVINSTTDKKDVLFVSVANAKIIFMDSVGEIKIDGMSSVMVSH